MTARERPAEDCDDEDGEDDLLKPLFAKLAKLSQDADRCVASLAFAFLGGPFALSGEAADNRK